MFIEQSHDEVYGCLKGGSRNSGGKRLAISMVEEAWLSEKEEDVFIEEKECFVEEKECFCLREKNVFVEEKECFRRRERIFSSKEDLNQHLKDFLKLVDSLDFDGENKERMSMCLFQFSLRDQASNWLERLLAVFITTWEDLTTRFLAQFFPPGRTAKLRNDILMFQQHHGESLSEAWTRFKDLLQKVPHQGINLWLQAAIKELSQYEDEGWNDPVDLEEGSLNHEKPDIEQLLGVMEYKVDALMKDAISLMGRSKGLFSLTSNEIYQLPPEPSRQEEFEHFVMNFILDQEERV
ncbi:zinc finger, CCHC-type containing protein [Tanacetum coccineum]